MTSIFVFFSISIFAASADIIVGTCSIFKKSPLSKIIATLCFGSAAVTIFYLLSSISFSYYDFSLASALYFACVNIVLLTFLKFTIHFTEYNRNKWIRNVFYCFLVLGYIDICIQLLNPFCEIAISYIPRDTEFAIFRYEMHTLYQLHLLYTYSTAIIITSMLLSKAFSVPKEYRSQYLFIILVLLLVVFVNALFLFVSENGHWQLDFSIWGYAIGMLVIYWCVFHYKEHGMNQYFRSIVMESINQGIIVFDYQDDLFMMNTRAKELLRGISSQTADTFKSFQQIYEIEISENEEVKRRVNYYESSNGEKAIHFEYKPLIGKNNRLIGRLLVLTDSFPDIDVLTGFMRISSLKSKTDSGIYNFDSTAAIAVFDINNLRSINSILGTKKGDKIIRDTANTIKDQMPKDTIFVRGYEAELLIIQKDVDPYTFQEEVNHIVEAVNGFSINNIQYSVQYAISFSQGGNDNMHLAIKNALSSLRDKKLLDKTSPSSNLITSLTKALEACDPDTEAHVSRTRNLGVRLANRLSLSDLEKSELSLLCLLHDIGKITIPMEILNKPSKLTPSEMLIMQSHAEKGSLIAACTPELKEVADMILHHHERWDGKGYPDGLSGTDIPILSRIIAVVDAYDAMTNDRVYRKAISQEQAIIELKTCAGTQFDPHITKEFTSLLEAENES